MCAPCPTEMCISFFIMKVETQRADPARLKCVQSAQCVAVWLTRAGTRPPRAEKKSITVYVLLCRFTVWYGVLQGTSYCTYGFLEIGICSAKDKKYMYAVDF